MEKKWYYDAFISYRHTEADSFVAKNLHRQLESFKLPGNVAHRLQESREEAKTKITRIFRDQEELPLVSNLADPIMEALKQSEFLIVICSPRLRESMWCKKEIETFISLRDREHVLLVLIEGEPEDSFPEELLYREVEETTSEGRVIKRRLPVEPLAADVRGGSQSEVRRKIKAETLRLAAPMFECGYDDLKQRHRERRLRRIITASLAGSAVCLLFGLVSTTMALRIRKQNMQIVEQSGKIEAQAVEIERQYAQAVRGNCLTTAQASEALLEKGDRIAAIETALSVFPGGGAEDIPYTAKAAYALSESLNLYKNGTEFLPDRRLEAATTIDFMKISPEGGRLLAVDDFCTLYVWNGADGGLLASFLLDDTLYLDEGNILFLNENEFLYPSEKGFCCYDIQAAAMAYEIPCGAVSGGCYSKENDRVVIVNDTGYIVAKGDNGALITAGEWQEDLGVDSGFKLKNGAVMDEGGALFAVAISSEEENLILVYEMETGELYRQYSVASSNVDSMKFAEKVLYVADNEEFDWGNSRAGVNDSGGDLYACDLAANGAFLWTYTSEAGWLYEVSPSSMKGSSYMLCSSYDSAVVLDKRDGSRIDSFFFGSQIVKLGNYVGKDAFLVFTRDGTWHYVNLETMTDLVGTAFTSCTSTNVKMFEGGDDYYATLPYMDRSITLYRGAADSNLETVYETAYRYAKAALSEDGAYLAVSAYADGYTTYVDMVKSDTGELLWHYEDDSYCKSLGFYPEGEAFTLVTSDGIYLFDEETGEQKAFYSTDDISGDYLCTAAAGRYIFFKSYKMLYGYDLADGSLAYEIELEEAFADGGAAAIDPSMKYAAIAAKEGDYLQLYLLEDLKSGQGVCLDEAADINAAYIEHLFFGGGGAVDAEYGGGYGDSPASLDYTDYTASPVLYVVYKNGDILTYPIASQNSGFAKAQGRQYQDMEGRMECCLQPEGAAYGLLSGSYDAYLICNEKTEDYGEITAHIDGFLAVDGDRSYIYLAGGTCIYRVSVYDAAALREEAGRQLGKSEP